VVGQQNADIADTIHLRDVAMATTFWLSMSCNFGCVIASDMQFDSRGGYFGVKLSDEDIADFDVQRAVVATATVLAFYIQGAYWRHLANTTKLCMCIGDVALCQITSTICSPCYLK